MDKQEAIERLKQNRAAAEFYAGMVQNTNAIENELKDIEAIDMAIESLSADVVQGEWRCMADYGIPECDQCGFASEHKYNYCPNCGAHMKGTDNE